MKTKKAGVVALYKVLVDGMSVHGGDLEWSLPKDGKPGEWHEVEGEVVVCKNGLHLTSNPQVWWKEKAEVYLVEAEGVVGALTDDKVAAKRARLMRRLTWAELAAFGIYPDDRDAQTRPAKKGRVAQPKPSGPSAAMQFVRVAWEERCGATEHSWRTVNATMWSALMLAITGGMSFSVDDFAEIYKSMRAGYWIGEGGERLYAAACEAGNLQACQSYEALKGRNPFMWEGKRLHVGHEFMWEGLAVKVTSFADENASLTACAYHPRSSHHEYRSSTGIARRFTIDYSQLVRAEKDRKTLVKITADATALQDLLKRDCDIFVDIDTLIAWTPEERESAGEWARLAKHDAGKKRISLPAAPAHMQEAIDRAEERQRARDIERLQNRIRMCEGEIDRATNGIRYARKELAELRAAETKAAA